jgi:hypothetical protein
MRTIAWSESVLLADVGKLVDAWADLQMDENPFGGSAHLYGQKWDGKKVEIRENQGLPEGLAVPEWEQPDWERGWSLADAGWLARLLRGEHLDAVTERNRESALEDIGAALARLRRAEEALPGLTESDLGRAVASLRLAITETERGREVVGGSPDFEPEVTQITDAGIELRLAGEVFVLDYALYPWFRGVAPGLIRRVERVGRDQVRWPALDIDLSIAVMRRPEEYPRVAQPDDKPEE